MSHIEEFTSEEELVERAVEDGIDRRMAKKLVEYVLHGTPRSDFLKYLLWGDLFNVLRVADDHNVQILRCYRDFLYGLGLRDCFGGREEYAHWVNIGGYLGHDQE